MNTFGILYTYWKVVGTKQIKWFYFEYFIQPSSYMQNTYAFILAYCVSQLGCWLQWMHYERWFFAHTLSRSFSIDQGCSNASGTNIRIVCCLLDWFACCCCGCVYAHIRSIVWGIFVIACVWDGFDSDVNLSCSTVNRESNPPLNAFYSFSYTQNAVLNLTFSSITWL